MYKVIRLFFIIIILFLLVSHSEAEYSNLAGFRKVEGFINYVELESGNISIDNYTYNITGDCLIKLNGIENSLEGLKPPAPGFFKWAEIYLDNKGIPVMVFAYYKVVEGIIEDISYNDRNLLLLEFRNDSRSEEDFKWYTLLDESEEILFFSLEKSDHIIMITARNKILYLF